MASSSSFSIEPVHPPQRPGIPPRPSSSSPSKQSLPCFEFLSCLKTGHTASSSSPGHSSCPEPSRSFESSYSLQCLEFLSCLQTNQIIPIHKINDVVIPTLIYNYVRKCKPILYSTESGDRSPLPETYDKIEGDLYEIKATLDRLKEWEGRLNTLTKELMHYDWEAICSEGTNSIEGLQTAIPEVHKMVEELKSHISLPLKTPLAPKPSDISHLQIPETAASILKCIPETNTSLNFNTLSPQQQQSLLYFSFFPENSLIRKKVPTYLWMGEDILQSSATADWEETAGRLLEELMAKGFIEHFEENKGKGDFNLCSMKPDTRSALLKTAHDRGFFDSEGNPTDSSRIAWLEKTKEGPSQHLSKFSNHEKLLTLFNINENCLDFPRGWLSKTKNLSVIHLGNWRSTSTEHYIEAERPDFLDHLGDAKLLRCLSLRGVCGIRKLPISIFKSGNLNILDLKSCRDFEKLPNEIGWLRNQLTHLDVSGCYLLDEMPDELATLSELRVLKGFIICPSRNGTKQCTLSKLAAKLGKLRKLGLYADKQTTGEHGELNCLSQFRSLRILAISWIAPIPPQSKPIEDPKGTTVASPSLPTSLEKLDLRCWPLPTMPSWIKPCELKSLKKLYIRGGKLSGMQMILAEVSEESPQWMVKILRVKFLKELRMDWGELISTRLFPRLVYLEKVDCPHLSSFPFEGVWEFQKEAPAV